MFLRDIDLTSDWMYTLLFGIVSFFSGLLTVAKIYLKPMETRIISLEDSLNTGIKRIQRNAEVSVEQQREIDLLRHMARTQETMLTNSLAALDRTADKLTDLISRQDGKSDERMQRMEARLGEIEQNIVQLFTIIEKNGNK